MRQPNLPSRVSRCNPVGILLSQDSLVQGRLMRSPLRLRLLIIITHTPTPTTPTPTSQICVNRVNLRHNTRIMGINHSLTRTITKIRTKIPINSINPLHNKPQRK